MVVLNGWFGARCHGHRLDPARGTHLQSRLRPHSENPGAAQPTRGANLSPAHRSSSRGMTGTQAQRRPISAMLARSAYLGGRACPLRATGCELGARSRSKRLPAFFRTLALGGGVLRPQIAWPRRDASRAPSGPRPLGQLWGASRVRCGSGYRRQWLSAGCSVRARQLIPKAGVMDRRAQRQGGRRRNLLPGRRLWRSLIGRVSLARPAGGAGDVA